MVVETANRKHKTLSSKPTNQPRRMARQARLITDGRYLYENGALTRSVYYPVIHIVYYPFRPGRPGLDSAPSGPMSRLQTTWFQALYAPPANPVAEKTLTCPSLPRIYDALEA